MTRGQSAAATASAADQDSQGSGRDTQSNGAPSEAPTEMVEHMLDKFIGRMDTMEHKITVWVKDVQDKLSAAASLVGTKLEVASEADGRTHDKTETQQVQGVSRQPDRKKQLKPLEFDGSVS